MLHLTDDAAKQILCRCIAAPHKGLVGLSGCICSKIPISLQEHVTDSTSQSKFEKSRLAQKRSLSPVLLIASQSAKWLLRIRASLPTALEPPATPHATLPTVRQAHATLIAICASTIICVSLNRAPKSSLEAAARMKHGKARSVRSTVQMVRISVDHFEIYSIALEIA